MRTWAADDWMERVWPRVAARLVQRLAGASVSGCLQGRADVVGGAWSRSGVTEDSSRLAASNEIPVRRRRVDCRTELSHLLRTRSHENQFDTEAQDHVSVSEDDRVGQPVAIWARRPLGSEVFGSQLSP